MIRPTLTQRREIIEMFNRLLCWIFFHPNLVIVHRCSRTSYKVQCMRCKRFYGMNDDVMTFLPWTDDLEFCLGKFKLKEKKR